MGGLTSTTLVRPRVVAVIATAGVSFFLPRTLRALARQTHAPNALIIVDVSRPDGESGTGTPIHQLLWESGIDRRCETAVIRAPKAENFGQAIAAAEEKIAEFFSADDDAPLGDSASGADTARIPIIGHDSDSDTPIRRPHEPGWLWLLHDDSAPASQALDLLLQAGENSRNLAIAGPKHNGWVRTERLREVGIRATRSARRVPDIAAGELDQGQFDSRSDVLAVGSAGMLIRWDIYRELGGFDPALGPFGDGLEICRRARLAGYRVEVVPAAVLYHAQASYRGLRRGTRARALALIGRPSTTVDASAASIVSPARRAASYSATAEVSAGSAASAAAPSAATAVSGQETGPARHSGEAGVEVDLADASASFAPRRRAQMYNAVLATAHLPWLRLMVYVLIAPLRALARMVGKAPDLAGAEIQAAKDLLAAAPDIRRARKANPLLRSAAAQRSLAPLEDSARQVRYFRKQRRDDAKQLSDFDAPTDIEVARARSAARRRRRAWIALTVITAVVALVGFFSLLASGQLSGGALLADHSTPGQLWDKARSPWIGAGDGYPGPADPYLYLWSALALPTSLFSLNAGMTHTLILLAALPLAGWGAWYASGGFTSSISARLWASLGWALTPALVISAVEGRMPAIIAHLLLPWAIGLAARGRRHPAAAAGAAIVFAGVVASAPILIALPLAYSLIGVIIRGGQRLRWAWMAIPSLALVAPTVAALATYPQRLIRFFLASPGPQVDGGEFSAAIIAGLPHGGILPNNLDPALAIATLCALLGVAVIALVGSIRAAAMGGPAGHRGRAALIVAALALAGAMGAASVDLGPGTTLAGEHVLIRPYPGPLASLAIGALIVGAISGARGLRAARISPVIMRRMSAPWAAGVVGLSLIGPIGLLPLISYGALDDARVHMYLQAAPLREVPALANEYQRSDERSRVLALRLEDTEIIGELWRGAGREFSDASAMRAISATHGFPRPAISHQPLSADMAASELAAAVAMLSDTSDPAAALDLVSRHAISLIILTPDTDGHILPARRTQIANVISAVPGLERVTENASGIIWRVTRSNIAPGPGSLEQEWPAASHSDRPADNARPGRGIIGPTALSRARIAEGDRQYPIPSTPTQVSVEIVDGAPGRELILAERANRDWHASLDGVALDPIEGKDWRQRFALPATGGYLEVRYRPAWYAPISWGQLAVAAIAVITALPIRRRGGRDV